MTTQAACVSEDAGKCEYVVRWRSPSESVRGFRSLDIRSFQAAWSSVTLVHEARIKNGGQFSLDSGSTVEKICGILMINPGPLGTEGRSAIDRYTALLQRDATVKDSNARSRATTRGTLRRVTVPTPSARPRSILGAGSDSSGHCASSTKGS